jgi:hypothetical protein
MNLVRAAKGFIFLATPHNGSMFTPFGKLVALLNYFRGSSSRLLEPMDEGSDSNKSLNRRFKETIGLNSVVGDTFCFFETVPEYLLGLQLTQVSSHRIITGITLRNHVKESAQSPQN